MADGLVFKTGSVDDVPSFACHKVVRAFKIGAALVDTGKITVEFASVCGRFNATLGVDFMLRNKLYKPMAAMDLVGGYLVFYADGYVSWSPAAAFEEGYKPCADRMVLVRADDLRKALGVAVVPGPEATMFDELYSGHPEALRRLAVAASMAGGKGSAHD